MKIVAQQDGKVSRVDSMTAMENILTANPELVIVDAFNPDMAIGAANIIAKLAAGEALSKPVPTNFWIALKT